MNAIREPKYVAGGVTLAVTLLILTPLCGLLFQCGCDWPWLGLHTGCNYFREDVRFRCPWCESMVTGVIASGVAIPGAVLTAVCRLSVLSVAKPVNECVIRISLALSVFITVAVLAALIAAAQQTYPIGVGRYLQSGSTIGVETS